MFNKRKNRIAQLELKLELTRQAINVERAALENEVVRKAVQPEYLPIIFLAGCASGWIAGRDSFSKIFSALSSESIPWTKLVAHLVDLQRPEAGLEKERELLWRMLQAEHSEGSQGTSD